MIEFRDVHKTYSSKRSVDALKGVSFRIEDGEFVFIIGKSGSGKSTLMKCITREEIPEEGDVLIDDFNIADMPRSLIPVLRRQVGMIYQDFRLIESKTVFENVAFAGEIIGIPRKSLNRTVQLMLNVVGLKDKADNYPQELSGGEQQRVAIARAMINNPKIIVADEPTGDLDPETSENIMALLLEINRGGTTVIVCTHDSNLVDRMKKRVIELSEGLIVRDKEDSLYKEEPSAQEDVVEVALNVAFGDDPAFEEDAAYNDGYDDDSYSEHLPAAPVPAPILFGDEKPEIEDDGDDVPVSEGETDSAETEEKTETEEIIEEIPLEDIDLDIQEDD